jgi:hypothetical protein
MRKTNVGNDPVDIDREALLCDCTAAGILDSLPILALLAKIETQSLGGGNSPLYPVSARLFPRGVIAHGEEHIGIDLDGV